MSLLMHGPQLCLTSLPGGSPLTPKGERLEERFVAEKTTTTTNSKILCSLGLRSEVGGQGSINNPRLTRFDLWSRRTRGLSLVRISSKAQRWCVGGWGRFFQNPVIACICGETNRLYSELPKQRRMSQSMVRVLFNTWCVV